MPRGAALLIIVLLIGAAGLALAVSSVWLGVGGRELAQVWDGATQAKLVAEGCLENALLRLKIDPAYNGETLSQSGKSCIITITKSGVPLSSATVSVAATAGDYGQQLSADIEASGQDFKIVSWSEN
jgi:hypothetical protein